MKSVVEAERLTACLNSTWLRAAARLGAVPAASGFARFNAQTIARLPLPSSAFADSALTRLAREGRAGALVQEELDEAVAGHLGLSGDAQDALRAVVDGAARHRHDAKVWGERIGIRSAARDRRARTLLPAYADMGYTPRASMAADGGARCGCCKRAYAMAEAASANATALSFIGGIPCAGPVAERRFISACGRIVRRQRAGTGRRHRRRPRWQRTGFPPKSSRHRRSPIEVVVCAHQRWPSYTAWTPNYGFA